MDTQELETLAYDNRQICIYSNNKTLLAASNFLGLPNGTEKSPAAIHGKQSRIQIMVTDFEKQPSVCTVFYLRPEEIRRLYHRACFCKGTKPFEFYSFKFYEHKEVEGGRIKARQLKIERTPYMVDYKTGEVTLDAAGNPQKVNLPWQFTIAEGHCTKQGKDFTATNIARKRIDDDMAEDFFCQIVSHLEVWETVVGGCYLKQWYSGLKN